MIIYYKQFVELMIAIVKGYEVIIYSMTDEYDNSSIQDQSFIKSTININEKKTGCLVLFGYQ
jgi:hypothetical protein